MSNKANNSMFKKSTNGFYIIFLFCIVICLCFSVIFKPSEHINFSNNSIINVKSPSEYLTLNSCTSSFLESTKQIITILDSRTNINASDESELNKNTSSITDHLNFQIECYVLIYYSDINSEIKNQVAKQLRISYLAVLNYTASSQEIITA